MWKLYEDGLPYHQGTQSPRDDFKAIPIDVVPHPRNLNQLFVIYAGLLVLSSAYTFAYCTSV